MTCRHFGVCGGCSRQDLTQQEQLDLKSRAFQELLAPLKIIPGSIQPSPDPWHYRSKVELSFGDRPAPGLGYRRRGKWWEVVDIEECLIFDPQAGQIANQIKSWAKQEGLSFYNPRRHEGFLRYLVLRRSRSGRKLAMLVTSSGDLPKASLREAMDPFGLSILWGIKDGVSDTAVPERCEIVEGQGFLEESLLGRPFRYSWSSFFQTNPAAFEKLLEDAVTWARSEATGSLLDLYCGVGPFAISLAGCFGATLAVENAVSSIQDAQVNGAGLNIEWRIEAVEKMLPALLEESAWREGLVIVDPPRSGLHPKALEALCEKPCARLIYVSCNPARTCREEMPRFCESYKINLAKAYDFFPQTDHYEAIFLMERR